MTFDELVDFLEHRMRMSHIYQPLLIQTLIDAGGTATVRQIAQAFLAQDESQLRYYEQRIKQMPVPVLKRHGILEADGDVVKLTVKNLTYDEKVQLRMLCQQKLHEFVARRGLAVWDHRMLEMDPIPDSLRYIALKESGGRCALCGVTRKEQPLDVDHIIPRSRGGRNVLSNLQILCSRCNRAKSNRDATDFRLGLAAEYHNDCPWCAPALTTKSLVENSHALAIPSPSPVSDQHVVIVPRRHTRDIFTMTGHERADADDLLRILRREIIEQDPRVNGFHIRSDSVSAKEDARTAHAQIHLIPRRLMGRAREVMTGDG